MVTPGVRRTIGRGRRRWPERPRWRLSPRGAIVAETPRGEEIQMTTIAAGARPRVSMAWVIVPLLALAVFINYVDRGNLATAGPLIKDEMKLSAEAFGLIVSAFFWSYTPGQLL